MKYLLDTDWIINLLAGKQDAEEQMQHLDPAEIAISLATIAEVYESAFQYDNPEAHIQTFRSFFRHFQLLNLNLPIMEKFAEIRSYLRRRGELISDFDMLLGATALHHELTVLTYNALIAVTADAAMLRSEVLEPVMTRCIVKSEFLMLRLGKWSG